MRTKAKIKPPKKTLRQSAIPVTESDKLMNADTYIGPLKKKGRPKTTNAETNFLAPHSAVPPSDSGTQEVIVIDESDSDSASAPAVKKLQVKSDDIRTPVSRDTNKKNRKTKQPTTAPFSTGPLTRRATQFNETPALLEPKTESHEPSILDVLAYLSATSSEPNAQNATILAALSSIDSPESLTSGNTPNTGLVSALKHLLFLYSNSVNHEPGPSQKTLISPSHDDGIVILDKENINPSKVQKKSEKDSHTRKISDSSSLPSSGLHSPERQIQSLKPSTRPNDKPSNKAPLKESILKAGSDRSVRKRTLSEFMDEKDSCRSRGKGKERERVERRDGHRHSHLQHAQRSVSDDSLRHYPRFAASNQPRVEQPSSYYRTGMEPWSSPPRPSVILQDHGGETLGGVDKSRKLQSVKISASSPVRSVQAQRDARKKYVVPEWARTSTATQPRLSEDAQWALEEAEQKKKQERSLARKRLSTQNKSGTRGASTSTLKPKKLQPRKEYTTPQKPQFPQGPIATTSSGPLFAVADISLPIFASTRSSSPPPKPSPIPKTPKTPTRNRLLIRATPGGEDSLFTPVMRSGSLFGSANSHSSRTTLPLTFTSPLGNRKKARIAPECSILRLKGTVLADAWSTAESAESKTEESEQPDEDPSVTLNQELENAFDDLDCPPSSLPIASSDIGVDNSNPETFKDLDPMDADDENETKLVKPYWPGLPPSSPPPPSSPMMLPEAPDFEFQTDDEMDNLELPVATDSETDPDPTAFDTDISSPSGSPAYCNDQNETTSTTDEFSAYFPQQEHSPNVQDNPTLTMDVFEQFTNFSNDDDLQGYVGGIPNSDLDSVFQNGLDGIDFTEFWETFRPLIDDNAKTYRGANVNGGSTHEKDATIDPFENIDPTKLADEMQTLLSGCLM